jgi:hypothetical protein
VDNEQLVLNGYFSDQHEKVVPNMDEGASPTTSSPTTCLPNRGLSWRGLKDCGGDCGIHAVSPS